MKKKDLGIGKSYRLQGNAFKVTRKYLKMVSYRVSLEGNICAHMIHKITNEKYHHWLNPVEKARFDKVKHEWPRFKPIVK